MNELIVCWLALWPCVKVACLLLFRGKTLFWSAADRFEMRDDYQTGYLGAHLSQLNDGTGIHTTSPLIEKLSLSLSLYIQLESVT